MIGLPSGLERVRWKRVGHLAAAFDHAEDLGAARARGFAGSPSTSAPAPSAITKPSRFLENGLAALLGRIVRGGQRREQREADQRFGIDRAVGADAERGVGFAAADRLDAELDGGGARGAGGRQRNRRALGAEAGRRGGRRPSRTGSARGCARNAPPAAAREQVVVGDDGRWRRTRRAILAALRPLDLDRRHGEEQRPGKSCAADRRIRRRLLRRRCRPCARRASVAQNGSTGMKSTVPAIVVFRPSVGKRRDGVDAGSGRRSACSSCRPCRAPSEVTTPMPVTTTIGARAVRCARALLLRLILQPAASTSARPSPRQ